MKSHIKTVKIKLPLHEFPFVKATAPFSFIPDFQLYCKDCSDSR